MAFPLTRKQVESSMAVQNLAPQVKALRERYSKDEEKVRAQSHPDTVP